MNILLLSQFYSNTKGGGEYVFRMIAKVLAENNHKVWVITNKITNESYPEIKNIKIVFVKPELEYQGGLPVGFSSNIQYCINAVRTAYKIIKKEKIDIVHSNNFAPALAGSIISGITRVRHVTTIHDIFSSCGKNFWKEWSKQNNVSKINSMLIPFFEKLLIRLKYDGIHAGSETTKKDLIEFGMKKPIQVIPYIIENQPVKREITDQLQFICIGRLVFYKNVELIIKAVHIAAKENPKIKLIIVGDGPQRESLEEMVADFGIKDNVDFKGQINNEDKNRLLATSNAMLFPSTCEGLGLVMMEAFLHHKPVIVSKIPPMSEFIEDEKTGFVLEPDNPDQWAQKILELSKKPEISGKMGQIGNKILLEKYTSEKFYDGLINMYTENRKF